MELDYVQKIINSTFPQLEICDLIKIGEGWDNYVFKINNRFAFRFPKHLEASILLQNEIKTLSHIHHWFGRNYFLKFPNLEYTAQPSELYPYLYCGYEFIEGQTACNFSLTDNERTNLINDFAVFLKKLHNYPLDKTDSWELSYSFEDRMDPVSLCHRIYENLEILKEITFFTIDTTAYSNFMNSFPKDLKKNRKVLIHGDLYARHLILCSNKNLVGIIDWGDIDVDHPAIDYQILFTFFPISAHKKFFEIYGNIDEETLLLSKLRALLSSSGMVATGYRTNDKKLLREGLWGLDNWLKCVL
jgi:aminoglycoside phosphotransferase (APT) family kinase protein